MDNMTHATLSDGLHVKVRLRAIRDQLCGSTAATAGSCCVFIAGCYLGVLAAAPIKEAIRIHGEVVSVETKADIEDRNIQDLERQLKAENSKREMERKARELGKYPPEHKPIQFVSKDT